MARILGRGRTRSGALRGLMAGATAAVVCGTLLAPEETEARKRRRRNRCAGRNWCVNRTNTCGPAGGYDKCPVTTSGNHTCVEIFFQVSSGDECGPANCTDCQCVPAVGGSDKCTNGTTGYDYICVRKI